MLLALMLPFASFAQNTQTFDFEDNAIPADWTNDATYPWVVTSVKNHTTGGSYSIKSGNAGSNSTNSDIEATFFFYSEGTISFYCWSSCESATYDWDYGMFFIDGVQQGANFRHVTDWVYKTFTVPAGSHTFKWRFKKDGSSAGGDDCFYVDDIVIDLGEIPSCFPVLALQASEINTESVTLSWVDENNTGATYSVYQISGTDTTEVDNVVIANNTAVITELSPNTLYTFGVVADCGDAGLSSMISVNVRTACGAINQFPWEEDFESYASGLTNIPCWSNYRIVDGTGYGTLSSFKIYVGTNGSNSTHQLQLADMPAGTMTKLLLPEMNLPEGENYMFTLDVYRNTSSNPNEGIRVFVSADTNLDNATELAFISRDYTVSDSNLIPAEASSDWYNYELPLGMNGTVYIIIRGESQYGSSTYMDNFKVKRMPNCPKPTNLAASQIFGRTATLAWRSDADNWQVEYKKSTETEWNEQPATDSSIVLTDLAPTTTYNARVKAICPDDESDYSREISFTTKAACQKPTNLTVVPTAFDATVTWRDTIASAWQLQLITVNTNAPNDTSAIVDITDTVGGYLLEGLIPEHAYIVRLWANCGEDDSLSQVTTKNFTTLPSCFVPSNVNVTLTPGNGSVATLSWVDSIASEWEYMLIHGTDTTYEVVNDNPVEIENLTAESEYAVRLRAVCEEGLGNSQWSNMITFTPTDAYTITVNDGTNTNDYVPFYGYYVDNNTHSRFIIPAENLAPMTYGTINEITFYVSQTSVNFGAARFSVFMSPAESTTVNELTDTTNMTKVYGGSLSISNHEMVVTLDEPYTYMGGNLMFAFEQPIIGSYSYTYWYGVTATGASFAGYNDYNSQRDFLPKMTFDFTPGEAPTCDVPTNLAITDTTGHTASFTWEGDADAIEYKEPTADTWITVPASDSPFTLEGLEQNTNYIVRMKVVCDDEVYYSNIVNFTTIQTCVEPYDINVIAIPGSGSSVYVTWSDSSSASAWQVRTILSGEPSEIIDVDDTVGGFLLENLIPEARYTVEVRSVCDATEGDISHWVSFNFVPSASVIRPVGPESTTTSNYLPTYNYYNYSLTQQIYTPAELGAPGDISGIEFKNTGTEKTRTIDIYMVNTTKTTFTSSSDWITVAAADKVFSGEVTFVNGEWTSIAFDNPFTYDSTSNVAIIVDDNTGAYTSDPHMANLVYEVDGYQAIYSYGDYTDYDPTTTISASGTRLSSKNHIRIAIGEPPACAKPKNITVSNIGKHEATVHWVDTVATAWQVMVNGDQENLIDATADSVVLTGLQTNTNYIVSIRAICDPVAEEISEWSIPATFRTAIACPTPTNVSVVAGPTTAAVSWNYTDAEDATFSIYQVAGTDTTDFAANIDTTFYTLTGLTPLTQYRFLLQANCEEGDANYVVFTFRTLDACVTPSDLQVIDSTITAHEATIEWSGYQESYNVRYRAIANIDDTVFSDDFENGLGNWTIYTQGDAGAAWRLLASASSGLSLPAHSGDSVASAWSWNSSAYNANNWLITPQLPLGGILTFWVGANASYPDSYEVKVSTTGNAIANFTNTVKTMAPAGEPWTEVTIDLSEFAGQQGYIAFHHVDYDMNYLLIDDVVYGTSNTPSVWTEITSDTTNLELTQLSAATTYEVQVQGNCDDTVTAWTNVLNFTTLPSCLAVTDIVATEATANSITLTWNNANEGSGNYVITDGDSIVYTITNVTDTGCVVTGLEPNTQYTFAVRVYCAADDSSAVAGTIARTGCAPLTELPYVENFEGDTRYCWDLVNFGVGNGADYALTGTKFLFVNPTSDSSFAILPAMDTTISGLAMNFYYRHYTSQDGGTLYVGYVNDNGDTATFMAVDSIDLTTPNTEYSESAIYTFEEAPAGSRMALRAMNSHTAIIFDSVTVMERPSCIKPTNLAYSDVRNHSALLSWTENGTANAWQIMLNDDEDNLIAADSTVFMLTGLEADSTYTVSVRANCGLTNGVSEWSAPVTFTTAIACPAVINLSYSATAYTVTLDWDEISSTPETYKIYSVVSGTNTLIDSNITVADLPYTITDLTPETQYTFGVQTICAEGEATMVTITTSTGEVCPPGLVCIGAGTATNSYLPTYQLYNYSLTQQIYTAAEIGDTGDIHSVAFYNTSSNVYARNLDIYLVNTNKSSFTGATDWIPATPADKVFSGSVTFNTNTWTTIEFTTPFNFDGNSNLAIIVDDNSGEWHSSMSFLAFSAQGQALRVFDDNTNFDPANPNSGDSDAALMNVKNRIRLGIGEMPTTYDVTVTVDPVNAGTVAGAPVVPVAEGDSVTLTATANTGYVFTNWTMDGNVLSAANPYTFAVNSDMDIVANFQAGTVVDTFTVTLNTTDGGTVSPMGSTRVADGTLFTATATADSGYHFVNWTNANGAAVSTNNPYAFTVNANVTLTAHFQANDPQVTYYNVIITSADSTMGTATATATGQVAENTSVTATAVALTGYRFANWTDANGNIVNATNPYTFTVTSDVTLKANFVANGPTPVEATINASEITYWVGEGTNQAVVAINWADAAYAWGVKFSAASITIQDALDIIKGTDRRFDYTLGDYGLENITFDENDIHLSGSSPWNQKLNNEYGTGLAQNVVNGDFVKWGEDNAGTVVDSTYYEGWGWYYTYVFEMTILPIWAYVGIQSVDMSNVSIYSANSTIYVKGAEGQIINIYDLNGRTIVTKLNATETMEIPMEETGVYLVRIGNAPAKRVIVMR